MTTRTRQAILAVVLFSSSLGQPAGADVLPVDPGESIQAAIDAAAPGDVVSVAAGTYVEDIDFTGKAIAVVGSGPETVLRGTGAGSVVRFVSGEGSASILDSLVVTGGSADRGGGVHVAGASPTIIRTIVFANRARLQGSGIYLTQSSATVRNNLVIYNHTNDPGSAGDPHAIEVVTATPAILNNTVAGNDSNGIILRSGTIAVVENNLIIRNGSKARGRGICDFSTPSTVLGYNLFWKNRRAALLTDGIDFKRIATAERVIGPPRVLGNVDGNPEILLRRLPKLGSPALAALSPADLAAGIRPDPAARRLRAIDAGNPDPAHDDRDGSRNDLGFTGGPESPLW
jgi:nitrous oxidase accessory protein NosD